MKLNETTKIKKQKEKTKQNKETKTDALKTSFIIRFVHKWNCQQKIWMFGHEKSYDYYDRSLR